MKASSWLGHGSHISKNPASHRPRSSLRKRHDQYKISLATMSVVFLAGSVYLQHHNERREAARDRIEAAQRYSLQLLNDMVEPRRGVDRVLRSKMSMQVLFDRAEKVFPEKHHSLWTQQEQIDRDFADEAAKLYSDLRTFSNYLQQIGFAMEQGALDEQFAWGTFGAIVKKYGPELQPYILEVRRRQNRPTVYEDLDRLIVRMAALDARYGKPQGR